MSNPIPRNIAALDVGLDVAIGQVMKYNANESQNFMRSNAPWTDRTGNARQGLFARAYHPSKGRHVIVLWHSVSYGIWLELANGRKYKIVEPAWRRCASSVMADLQGLMRSVA